MTPLRLDFQARLAGPTPPGARAAAVTAFVPGLWGYQDPAGVTAFDAGSAPVTDTPDFYRDGHTAAVPRAFCVAVPPGGTFDVRLYTYAPPVAKVAPEGGGAYPLGAGPQHAEFSATDADGDGVLVIWLAPAAGPWTCNGIDVADVGQLPPAWT